MGNYDLYLYLCQLSKEDFFRFIIYINLTITKTYI